MKNKILSWTFLTLSFLTGLSSAQAYTLAELRTMKVLLVPGLLAESYLEAYRHLGVGGYFEPQLALFKELGIEAQRLGLESEAELEVNALKIVWAVKASSKPVLIIGHSKGGLDALMALFNYPEIRPQVTGLIAIQGPFWGTPLADQALDSKTLSWKLKKLFKKLGGSLHTLVQLSEQERRRWMQTEFYELAQLATEVPLLSVASYKTDAPGLDSILEPIRDHFLQNKVSDGLVPTRSALLPWGKNVTLAEVDHAMTVMACDHFPYDQKKLTLSLLSELNSHPGQTR